MDRRALYNKRNKLLRYKDILDLYLQVKHEDIPVTRVWRKYIYPKYHISRSTLYTILSTPVIAELRAVEDALGLFGSQRVTRRESQLNK